jgi:hypothetical protein
VLRISHDQRERHQRRRAAHGRAKPRLPSPTTPYPDGHGFHHQVDLVGGPFEGSIIATSYEGWRALGSFHRELVALYRSLKGEVHLPRSYENLRVSLKGDGLGHMTVQADALAGDCMDTRLSFNFRIDQTQLSDVIADVERLFLEPARKDR